MLERKPILKINCVKLRLFTQTANYCNCWLIVALVKWKSLLPLSFEL